jgi:hypothetical protein
MGVSGQSHAPARGIIPGKETPVTIVQEAGWAPEPVWTQRLEEKFPLLYRGSNLYKKIICHLYRSPGTGKMVKRRKLCWAEYRVRMSLQEILWSYLSKSSIGRQRMRWESTIKTHHRDTDSGDGKWTELVLDCVQWRNSIAGVLNP